MGLVQTIGTILKETLVAPTSGSYVIKNPHGHLVLRQGGNYPNIDLSGYDLAGLDLHGTNLTGAVLRGTNLSGANLSGADLHGADLTGAIISKAKFNDAKLDGARLEDVIYDIRPSGLPSEATG